MKHLIVTILVLCSTFVAAKDVSVGGYMKNDGTYVAPHMRSSPNGIVSDNWSTKGNINPYTGKVGTKNYPTIPPLGIYTQPGNVTEQYQQIQPQVQPRQLTKEELIPLDDLIKIGQCKQITDWIWATERALYTNDYYSRIFYIPAGERVNTCYNGDPLECGKILKYLASEANKHECKVTYLLSR